MTESFQDFKCMIHTSAWLKKLDRGLPAVESQIEAILRCETDATLKKIAQNRCEGRGASPLEIDRFQFKQMHVINKSLVIAK